MLVTMGIFMDSDLVTNDLLWGHGPRWAPLSPRRREGGAETERSPRFSESVAGE